MAALPFNRLVVEAQSLSDDEKRQLRDLLDGWLAAEHTVVSEDEFERRLVALGILSVPQAGARAEAAGLPRALAEIHGALLSERILEDRR